MKLKLVVVDLEIAPRTKRNLLLVVTPLAVLGLGLAAWAAVPNEFAPGETLTADRLNVNFKDLDRRIDALGDRLAYAGRVCGKSAGASPAQGGYGRVNDVCADACGAGPAPHVCIASEVISTVATGTPINTIVGAVPTGQARYSAGLHTGILGGGVGNASDDCRGWTQADEDMQSQSWYMGIEPGGIEHAYAVTCATSDIVFLCCR